MKRYTWLLCLLVLAAPLRGSGQEAGDVQASDYSDYFGDSRENENEGPHSLGEARAQGTNSWRSSERLDRLSGKARDSF